MIVNTISNSENTCVVLFCSVCCSVLQCVEVCCSVYLIQRTPAAQTNQPSQPASHPPNFIAALFTFDANASACHVQHTPRTHTNDSNVTVASCGVSLLLQVEVDPITRLPRARPLSAEEADSRARGGDLYRLALSRLPSFDNHPLRFRSVWVDPDGMEVCVPRRAARLSASMRFVPRLFLV